MAEDDPEDRMLAKEAFEKNRIANELFFVEDGEELMDYLYQRGKFTDMPCPKPGLLLLDISMPRKNGFEALKEIRADPKLKMIPVVVLTCSQAEADIVKAYDLGVNSFISKPMTFNGLVDVVHTLNKYWLGIVELPPVA
ncbi:MAG: response regulator [Pseudomonadota bacterium]